MHTSYSDYLDKIDKCSSFSITTSMAIEDEDFFVDGDVLREVEIIFKRYGISYSDWYRREVPFDIWLQCLDAWKKECQSDEWLAEFSTETLEILCAWTEEHKDCNTVCLCDMLI